MRSLSRPARATRLLVVLGTVALLATTAGPALAHGGHKPHGFKTSQAPMLEAVKPGVKVRALITTGDTLSSGYRFEAIPDGIAIKVGKYGRVDVYVNHETSTVPFPYTPAAPTDATSQNDFDNAQVSRLTLDRWGGGVLAGRLVIKSGANFQRFCSNYLATSKEGFSRDILLTNEEAVDWVNRTGKAWPATIGADQAREAGAVVAYDVKSGARKVIWGMGRLNHENSLALRGYGRPVVMTGDDTFTTSPSQSQAYMYIARSSSALWRDQGSLYAFVSDDPAHQKYEDFAPGDTSKIKGHFIRVPKLIATGRNSDGTDLMAADVPASLGGPFPLPPNDGSWQRDPAGVGIDGPQWVLDHWSRTHGAFGFVRLEDMAYDKRPGKSNIVYLVDSGRGTAGPAGPGISTNGRVWKMVLDKYNPRKVKALSVLIEGDDNPVKTVAEMHQPDNIESTRHGLYFTEDPGSSQQFTNPADPGATTARIWQYKFSNGATTVIAKVDQSADGGPTDVDGFPNGRLGAWESSGIVDASAAFGPGAFLVAVQAHTLWVQKGPGDDNVPPAGPDFTYKREGGQLLLIRIPGG